MSKKLTYGMNINFYFLWLFHACIVDKCANDNWISYDIVHVCLKLLTPVWMLSCSFLYGMPCHIYWRRAKPKPLFHINCLTLYQPSIKIWNCLGKLFVIKFAFDWCLSCRVNCSFYFKIGACRHGERCSRLHNKPTFSQVSSYFFCLSSI